MRFFLSVLFLIMSICEASEKKVDTQIPQAFIKDIQDAAKWLSHLSDETKNSMTLSENIENNIYQLSECVANHLSLVMSKMSDLLKKEYSHVLPWIVLFVYKSVHNSPELRYYDTENISILPVSKDDLWVVVLPFKKSPKHQISEYTSFVLDLKNFRAM
jgi:hypothetical protein